MRNERTCGRGADLAERARQLALPAYHACESGLKIGAAIVAFELKLIKSSIARRIGVSKGPRRRPRSQHEIRHLVRIGTKSDLSGCSDIAYPVLGRDTVKFSRP